jgi:hypothetical protein
VNSHNPSDNKDLLFLEPFTTEALRTKLFDEFGKKGFQNKPGESIEQSVWKKWM